MKSIKKLLNVFKRKPKKPPIDGQINAPTPRFQIFRLPILVQLLIFKQLGLLELIDFSLLSRRSKALVQSLNLKLLKFDWSLDFQCHFYVIHLEDSYHQHIDIAVSAFPIDPNEHLGKLKLNGTVLPVGRHYNKGNSILGVRKENMSSRERMEVMDQLTAHLLDIFRVDNHWLTLNCVNDTVNCFVWKYTKQFSRLMVSGHRQLRKVEIKFIMEQLIVTDSLFVRCPVTPNYKYSGPLKMSRISVSDACWLTVDSVMNMDCARFYANTTSLTCDNLNAILKKWSNGQMNNLVVFSIIKFNPIPRAPSEVVLNRILEGITSSGVFLPTQKSRKIRRNDGVIAIVEVINDLFLFYKDKVLNE